METQNLEEGFAQGNGRRARQVAGRAGKFFTTDS
jgi:hypothetical protein